MKNKLMRAATILMVLTLMTSCFVGSTFAKYTTNSAGSDQARVATWGFTAPAEITFDLFKNAYNDTVLGASSADVIAPGTTNFATFQFKYDGEQAAPEVDYTLTVDATFTAPAGTLDDLNANKSFTWTLSDGSTTWGPYQTTGELVTAIENLAGTGHANGVKSYEAGTLPAAFPATDTTYTVTWNWAFGDSDTPEYDLDATPGNETSQNQFDTMMGNKPTLDQVKLDVSITATQLD